MRTLVREVLAEDAYKERTGKRFTADIDKIRDNLEKKGYFLHFSDVPKIGVNPKSPYLPGSYFYPNIKEIYEGFVKDVVGTHRGAGRASRYVFLVRLKDGLNIVEGSEILERAHETLRSIAKPLLDLDIDEGPRRGREKTFMQALDLYHRNMSGSSVNIERFTSADQLRERGLLDKVYDNYRELAKIYHDFVKRPRMSAAQKEDFLKAFNGRLKKYLERFGGHLGKLSQPLSDLEPSSVKDFISKMQLAMHPLKPSPDGTLQLSDADIDTGLKEIGKTFSQPSYNQYGISIPNYSYLILAATIASNGMAAMVKSYADYITASSLQNAIPFMRWLLDDRSIDLHLRSGETVSLREVKAQCLKRLEDTMGKNFRRLMEFGKKGDQVGVSILLVMGSGDVDGVNDTGHSGQRHNIVWGHGGILGKYEGAQLFLSAPVSEKIEIVTMIDRYEGKPVSWDPPGSHTPDQEQGSGEEKEDLRVQSLQSRLSRKVPAEYDDKDLWGRPVKKTFMKRIPRERYSGE